MFEYFLDFAMKEMESIESTKASWQERLRSQWKESEKMPRKKKKKLRKSILLDWNISERMSPFYEFPDFDMKLIKEIFKDFKNNLD